MDMRNKSKAILSNPFKQIIKGKTMLFGIGNTLRCDDGFGPILIERLMGKVNAPCIDGGSAPENYFGKIIKEKPDTLLIFDAVHLDLKPGAYKILPPDKLQNTGFSTHNIPLKILTEYVKSEIDADIYVVGVQPLSVSFGTTLSKPVAATINKIENLIIAVINKK
jgi:hydrogenase 3 maturation protease